MFALKNDKLSMVFNYEKAAKLIKKYKPKEVEAGLAGDWGHTCGIIYSNGKPQVPEGFWDESTWATPQVKFDDEIMFDCWLWEDDIKKYQTHWSKKVLNILR